MAAPVPGSPDTHAPASPSAGGGLSAGALRTGFIALCALFFFMGFITVLNDILVPKLKGLFNLSYLQSSLIQFCFFAAYGLISIPASAVIRTLGYKRALVLSMAVIAGACLLFLPAADSGVYWVFLGALFLLASGITLLQVAANPYVTSLGAPSGASFRLVLVQAFNSLGTTIAPRLGAVLILGGAGSAAVGAAVENDASSVKSLYLGIAIAVGLVALGLAFLRMPKVAAEAETPAGTNRANAGTFAALRFRHLSLGVVGIFVYVGAEVAIGTYMVNYLLQPSVQDTGFFAALWTAFGEAKPFAQATPTEIEVYAGTLLSLYWGGAMVGRFLGSAVMTVMKPNRLLAVNATAAALLVALALMFQGSGLAAGALLLVGFFNSVMFPVIFSLSVARLGYHTTNASGLLCTAIVGGALVPAAQGWLADTAGLPVSYILPLLCYLYILFFAVRGYRPVDADLPEAA